MSYTRVSKLAPCPICKKPDWCRVFTDGWVECMRVQSDRPAKSGGWMWGPRGDSTPHPGPLPDRGGEGVGRPPTINATKLHRDWLAATTPTQLAEFASALGLSVAALVAANAAWAEPHSAWAFPMCDGHGNVVGIRLRRADGIKFAVRGSRQGIFLGKAESGKAESGKVLFVCEGPTDTAAAVELGLFAVGRPNCCCGGADIKIYARRHRCHRQPWQ